METKSKIAVTGGAGFIGSCLVNTLAAQGHSVLSLDNYGNGRKEFLNTSPNLQAIEGDLREDGEWTHAWKAFAPDYVVHLAAIHYIPYCNAHWLETQDVNVVGLQRVLDLSLESKGVVIASSAAVYGPNDNLHKETETMSGTDIYGVSKVMNEMVLELWTKWKKVPARAARFFNVYGPNETNPHIIPEILMQASKGDRIELGNMDTKRDYIYVEDIVSGVVALLGSFADGKTYDAYNIGTGKEYSARELVEVIGGALGRPIEGVSVPERYRPSDRPHLCADNSKLRALGWSPSYSIETGMKKLVEHEFAVAR